MIFFSDCFKFSKIRSRCIKIKFFPLQIEIPLSGCDDDGGGLCLCVGGGGGGVVYPATSSIMIVCLDYPPSNHNI